MIVTRGLSKKGQATGGVLTTFGFSKINLVTLLRMRFSTRRNRRRVRAIVEGRRGLPVTVEHGFDVIVVDI